MEFRKEHGSDNPWGLDPHTPAVALLRLLPEEFRSFERLMAAMAAMAVERAPRPLRLLLMASPPANNLLPATVAGLLVQDLVCRRRAGQPLLRGDLLVLTPAARGSMELLRGLQLQNVTLGEVWEIESLTRYTPRRGEDKPRVYFANPGVRPSVLSDRRAAAIIVEAMLPSILYRLPDLLNYFREALISVAIAPPLSQERLQEMLGYEEWVIWLWDPSVREESPGRRHIRVIRDDNLEEALIEAEECLGKCLELLSDTFPPLREAWGIYHQLRQLMVPMADLEELMRPSLRYRVDRMRKQDPPRAAAERHWGRLLSALDRAYQHLAALREPAKFWALAQRLHELLPCIGEEMLRIVLPRREHILILIPMLIQLFDQQAIEKIEFLTPIQEARRIAAGEIRWTLLPGCRPATYRFLDIHFPRPVEVFAYPYEAELEKEIFARTYNDLERWQKPEARRMTLSRLGLSRINLEVSPRRPDLSVSEEETPRPRPVRFLAGALRYEPDRLLEIWEQELESEPELEGEDRIALPPKASSQPGEPVRVVLEDGRELSYGAGQFVYVFYESLDQIRRLRAQDLRPGMRLVLLVDAVYEGIYERLLDALRKQVGVGRIYLALWQTAKVKLRKEHPILKSLYDLLSREGLSVRYPAFAAYFRGDDLDEATLAPQDEANMAIIARHSGLFRDDRLIRETFRWIEQERKLRRRIGRALHLILRCIVTGEGYLEALRIAREIGHEIYDVITAVEVETVRDVRREQKNNKEAGRHGRTGSL